MRQVSVCRFQFFTLFILLCLIKSTHVHAKQWQLEETSLSPRHEASMVLHKNQLFLLGGRGKRPINIMNADTGNWRESDLQLDQEVHHFQAVSIGNEIIIAGAFTGAWPNEIPLAQVISINTETNTIARKHDIPEDRQRGSAGSVVYQDKIYIIGGIRRGHMGGAVNWFDRYDPKSGVWEVLPDAPRARDHFQAVIVEDKLYAIAGRRTSHETGESISLTEQIIDVYDFKTSTWSSLTTDLKLPTPRAGNVAAVYGNDIFIVGGESIKQSHAHKEVEVFNTRSMTWRRLPSLYQGRHGGGLAVITSPSQKNTHLIAVSGCLMAGGSPELASVERLELTDLNNDNSHYAKRFETLQIDLKGPTLSETDAINPFTDFVYLLHAKHEDGDEISIRGFFAADGLAQHSSADEGNIWRAYFVAQKPGKWTFDATLYQGENLGFEQTVTQVTAPNRKILTSVKGHIKVSNDALASNTFTTNGLLSTKNGLFFFPATEQYWLKSGTNSPENFLGFEGIDGTYRASKQAREGEASSGEHLHEFASHIGDWRTGDPLWGSPMYGNDARGRGLIGAVNYLAAQGVNAQYFLSMNINGDGRDVWPYIDHQTFDRFDVSKLAQWNMIFTHMQNKGVLLHIVTQETENERLLDDGETGKFRRLYYQELIARFSHHQGLVWNLGEENGPADWSPIAQSDQQRIDMARFFANNDPYKHPVVIHSHATVESKEKLLRPLLESELDGISFQVENRQNVFAEIAKWRAISANHRPEKEAWLITMDEIGMWHTGAKVDADDPNHDSLRHHVLWGTLLSGGAGVEWYFGAHQPHNDLTNEDFRTRERLWRISKIAIDYMQNNTQFWSLKPQLELSKDGIYVASRHKVDDAQVSELVAYIPHGESLKITLHPQKYQLVWLNPISGERYIEEIKIGQDHTDASSQTVSFSFPTDQKDENLDWVLHLK